VTVARRHGFAMVAGCAAVIPPAKANAERGRREKAKLDPVNRARRRPRPERAPQRWYARAVADLVGTPQRTNENAAHQKLATRQAIPKRAGDQVDEAMFVLTVTNRLRTF